MAFWQAKFWCFVLLHLILQLNSDVLGNFKFVVTLWFSSAIHFVCTSFEIEIGHGSLNFVWAFTIDAFPQMLRSWQSDKFCKSLVIVLQLISSWGFHFKFVLTFLDFRRGVWKKTMMCMMCFNVSAWQKSSSHFQVHFWYYQSRLRFLKGVVQNTKIQV